MAEYVHAVLIGSALNDLNYLRHEVKSVAKFVDGFRSISCLA